MPQISSLSFNVSFEAHNPNRVGLSNTTPSLPAGFVGIFKVIQPDGYVRNGDIDNPDVTNVVSSCFITLVPDSAGQLQQGQYTIEFIGNAPGYLSTSFIRTFTLQYTAATISLRNDFDVFTPQLAYTDLSNYNVSGYTISSGPTRNWTATSPTTGSITSANSSIDIRYNNQYYAETYVIDFGVTVSYVSQAYPWLTLSHQRSQSTTVTACIPKSIEDLTQAIENLREESNASCGGDWARFEKANSLYLHLINMLRLVLIAGQHQDGFFDVYQQLLSYIQNGSVSCDSIGQVIPPYDFSDYESSIYDGQASYCQLVGDGVNTVYRVNHQLGDECVVVQVYEVATGKQVFCDLAVSTINSIDITFYEPPTLNQYRVVAVAGALGLRGQGFQPGGLTGQLLRKRTDADFDTEWADVTVALPYLVPYTGATQSVYLGEYGVEAGFVRLDTTPTGVPAVPAVMSWNDQEGTVDLRLKGNNVTLQVGQEMVARVVNKTGANLLESQYKAVRIRKVSEGGAQGQRLAVVLAQANTEFASTDMLGIVTESISDNQEGFITTFGTVRGINTTGSLQGETWVDGDILFLSPTVPGGLTNVKPSAPNHLSIVGYVEYAHQNNGKIFVHVQTSWELDELHNVAISSPTTGQVLRYDGTLWRNAAIPAVTSVGLATSTTGVTIADTPVTSSGVININIATASVGQSGLLSASDWATFNAKQSAITLTTTGNSGAATFVGSTLNIPNYTLSGLGGVPSTRSLTINGTAYDLSADRVWSVGTVTSVAALTIGTAGTDITSTVATGTTTPVITLNIPTASATNRGALSAADWTTFNNKQNALTNPVTGTGTTNYVPKFTGASTIGNSQIFDNGTNVGIGTASPTLKFQVIGDIASSTRVVTDLINGYNGGSTPLTIQTGGAQNLIFGTNNTERLRIFANGRVFVGASPVDSGYQLDVAGTGYYSGTLTLGGGSRLSAVSGNGLNLNTGGVDRLHISSSGSIGVGTTSPVGDGTALNVYGSSFATIKMQNSTTGSTITDGSEIVVAGLDWLFKNREVGSNIFYTSNIERFRIADTGVITVANLAGSGARLVVADASGNLSATTASSSIVSGSGTTNYVPKFTGASTIGNSVLQENSSSIGLGITPSAWSGLSALQSTYGVFAGNSQANLLLNAYYDVNTYKYVGTGEAARYRQDAGVHSFLSAPSGTAGGAITFTERLRIFANGRVFVGASPVDSGYQLDVAGSIRNTTGANFATSSGSVGIGTASPLRTLHIYRAGVATELFLESDAATQAAYYLKNTNNAIYVPAGSTGQIRMFVNGADRMTFDSSGNVGIGTTSPLNKLHVEFSDATAYSPSNTLTAAPIAYFYNNTSADAAVATTIRLDAGNLTGNNAVSLSAVRTGNADAAMTFGTRSGGGSVTERARITSSGELLINTTTDAGDYKLQVAGGIYATGNGANSAIQIQAGQAIRSTGALYLDVGTSGSGIFNLRTGTLGNNAIYAHNNGRVGFNTNVDNGYLVDVFGTFRTTNGANFATSSGSVGIGTASPGAKLQVEDGTSAIKMNSTGTNASAGNLQYSVGGTLKWNLTSVATSNDFGFYNNGGTNAFDFYIKYATGNVGIGTTSPSTRLHISQSNTGDYASVVLLSNSANTAADRTGIYGSAAPGTALPYRGGITFHPGASGAVSIHSGNNAAPGDGARMYIHGNGRVGINTTTDAGYQLDVNGNTRVTGKIDISANDSFGLNIVRSGTSAIAAQIYNNGGSNGWMLYGVESSAGGVIFSGTEAYASVIGSYNNYSLQMVTNNAVRMTVTGGGSVGIGTASPVASAILQVDSTTKGLLPPRMTTTQRDAITSPATGLIVYDTTVNKISVYNGTSWRYAQYE